MNAMWNRANLRFWQLAAPMTVLTIPLWFASFTMPMGKDWAYPFLVHTVHAAMLVTPVFIFFEILLLLLHMTRRAMGADIYLRLRLFAICNGIAAWTYSWHQFDIN
jgi:hypothetical protein